MDIWAGGNALQSILVHLRQTWSIDSQSGDVLTHSMDGYGKPEWVRYEWASFHDPTSALPAFGIPSIDNSVIYISLIHSVSMGSLAADISYAVRITALIASR